MFSFLCGPLVLMVACPHVGVTGWASTVRAADRFARLATTSTMAALLACASLRSYNRDVCVAPFTTRCLLLDERVARSSCSSSQPGSACLGAVTTASGLFPKVPSLSVWVGATNSSA